MKLPCWCDIQNDESNFNPPVDSNIAGLYFQVTQNVTETDGSWELIEWNMKPEDALPSNWGAVRRPMPVVYMLDSDHCSQCRIIQEGNEEGDVRGANVINISLATQDINVTVPNNGESHVYQVKNEDNKTAIIAMAVVMGLLILVLFAFLVMLVRVIQGKVTSKSAYELQHTRTSNA